MDMTENQNKTTDRTHKPPREAPPNKTPKTLSARQTSLEKHRHTKIAATNPKPIENRQYIHKL